MLLLLPLILHSGCSQPQAAARVPAAQRAGSESGPQEADEAIVLNPQSAIRNPQLPAGFAPVKIGILPLTELSSTSDTSQGAKLSAFVALLDAFGSQVKAPGPEQQVLARLPAGVRIRVGHGVPNAKWGPQRR
jgi:hypothetical protein